MANGVLKTEAEYYDDSETYSGDAGTETNMYVIEDIYDFVRGQAGHCTLVNDIDFSDHDTYRYGVSSRIIYSSGFILHGNNHKIRNLIVKQATSASTIMFGTMYDVIFENIILIGILGHSVFSGKCVRCKFGTYLFNASAATYPKYCEDCSFHVRGIASGTPFYLSDSGATFKRCHIHFDLVSDGSELTAFSSGSIYDTYFTGRCKFTSDMNRVLGAGSWYTSYASVEIAIPNTNETLSSEGAAMYGGISFINIDLLPQNVADSISRLYKLTDSQCRDANYLASIGFPVVPIS